MASFANVDFAFDMSVERVAEHPRITKPFSEEAWKALDALGEEVDKQLVADDVRLTMGGEPTFVSIDDFESGEWNADAVGPTKRALADKLIRRLRDRFAPGGFLHYGQGKWYPGEVAAALDVLALLAARRQADLAEPRAHRRGGRRDRRDRRKRPRRCSARSPPSSASSPTMSRRPTRIRPSGWSRKPICPPNVSPENSELKDPEARHRIARVFSRGLTEPSGYVLPVQRWQAKAEGSRWRSERWKTRRGALHLVPGDSPVGYRLPLGALPYVPPASFPYVVEADPTEPRGPLPDFHDAAGARAAGRLVRRRRKGRAQERVEQRLGDIDGAVRTAVTVEPRDGRLCVFLPPVERLEDYLELVAAAEAAAEKVGLQVQIEGYPPPVDPRLNVIRVAPDPGVIEVNIHPASSWRECVATTEAVYEEARLSRLGADKFMIDGKHAGTGGGNHVVVGGATPLDSPFLRRPDLLKSLDHLLAAASEPELLLLRPVHRPDQPGAARRRSAPRQPLRARDRAEPDPEARQTAPPRGRGCSTG